MLDAHSSDYVLEKRMVRHDKMVHKSSMKFSAEVYPFGIASHTIRQLAKVVAQPQFRTVRRR